MQNVKQIFQMVLVSWHTKAESPALLILSNCPCSAFPGTCQPCIPFGIREKWDQRLLFELFSCHSKWIWIRLGPLRIQQEGKIPFPGWLLVCLPPPPSLLFYNLSAIFALFPKVYACEENAFGGGRGLIPQFLKLLFLPGLQNLHCSCGWPHCVAFF